ncbi:DUF370 domain-containing protein [uncultured Ilyobacter sp.]|uniref:DUF370 domain-containing protein n=1 Tax=uncultured Ilyobacter sp. TaxID=544433 RepID=UPI0029C89BCD|nr:DUF370 domain-containing protein [uncultured Ilyobacter sp.]
MRPINIGFGNMVVDERIVGIIAPDSAPSKRLKDEAKTQNKLIDATFGRKTRALIITDSDHVIMSAINPETIAVRIEKGE